MSISKSLWDLLLNETVKIYSSETWRFQMNNDIVEGKWKQIKGDVKQFFGKLTDDDLTRADGGKDKIGRCTSRALWLHQGTG